MRVYRWPYRRGYRRLSGAGQFGLALLIAVTYYYSPDWGCKGRSSLRSSAPCMECVPGHPLGASRARDARRLGSAPPSRYAFHARGCRPLHPIGLSPMVVTYLIGRTHDDMAPALVVMAVAAVSLAATLTLPETARAPLR